MAALALPHWQRKWELLMRRLRQHGTKLHCLLLRCRSQPGMHSHPLVLLIPALPPHSLPSTPHSRLCCRNHLQVTSPPTCRLRQTTRKRRTCTTSGCIVSFPAWIPSFPCLLVSFCHRDTAVAVVVAGRAVLFAPADFRILAPSGTTSDPFFVGTCPILDICFEWYKSDCPNHIH